ncbi:MAG: glycoside hydrolase family 30 [Paenibacillaceae bacterium]|jgi:O-glycosyl hydrolase|nr:glycoside hydrolase family 30 [Paenibacillaceae bacterium]
MMNRIKRYLFLFVAILLFSSAIPAFPAKAAVSVRLSFDNAASVTEANLAAGGGQSQISLDSTLYYGTASAGKSVKLADRQSMYYRLKIMNAFDGLDLAPGQIYTISARVRVNSASVNKAGMFFLSVIDSTVPQEYTKAAESYLATDQGWAELKMIYTVGTAPVLGVAVEQIYADSHRNVVSAVNIDEIIISEYEEPAEPAPGVPAAVYKGTPVIDGQPDAIWQTATEISTDIFSKGTSGATAKTRLLWDESAVYVLAAVYDPVRSAINPLAYEQDAVEIFLDENNAKTKILDSDDAQYRISYLNQRSLGGQGLSSFASATAETDYGYLVEAAIPVQYVSAAPNVIMGLELQVNDDPGTGKRESIAKWRDPTNNSYKDASRWGTIRLVDAALPNDGVELSLYSDGRRVSFGAAGPELRNGVVMAPVAELFTALHAAVSWNSQTGTASIVQGGSTLTVSAGSTQAWLNGQPLALEAEAVIEDGVLLVPVSLAEALGATVSWDAAAEIVYMKSNQIYIHKAQTQQEIWGFGASANNPVNDLKNSPNQTAKEGILDKLFGTSGNSAGLSIVRLEINPFLKTDPVPANALQATAHPAEGVWDWDTDQHQIWFSNEAIEHGEDIRFYAVPWSAPAWMKDNQSEVNGGHLLPQYYDAYANYLKTWVERYRNVHGFDIRWLSVQNEPNTIVAYASAAYTHEEMDIVAGKVADAVHNAGLPVMVGAPEGNTRLTTYEYLSSMSEQTKAKLDFIPTHFYGGNTNNLAGFGKPLFQSEVSYTTSNVANISDGVDTGKQIADALSLGYHGWLRWWFVSPNNGTSGESLVQLRPDGTYSYNKRLFTMGQFSRFIRPGYVKVQADSGYKGLIVTAAKDPVTGAAAVVVINDSMQAIQSPVYGLTAPSVNVYRTSAYEDMAALGQQTVVDGTLTRSFPAQSVTTLVE